MTTPSFQAFGDELVKIAGGRDALRVLLTGRVPVYHGTSASRAKRILQEGIVPNSGGGISDIVLDPSLNQGLSFSTLNPGMAKTYADQQRGLERGRSLTHFMDSKLWQKAEKKIPGLDFIRGFNSVPAAQLQLSRGLGQLPGGKKIVKARIPRRFLAQQEVLNPEADRGPLVKMLRDRADSMPENLPKDSVPPFLSNHYDALNPAYQKARPTMQAAIKVAPSLNFMTDVVQRGGIHPQNIVGSPSYRGTTIQDLKNHFQDIRQDPKGVGKDVLRSLFEVRHRPRTLAGF